MKWIILFCFTFILKAEMAMAQRPKKNLINNQTPRTVMVQLFQWPWKDIARECEIYLGPAGFSAVQISPPTESRVLPNHPWWEVYQPASYVIHNRLGNQQEFQNMVTRCQKAGVDIYVDIVLNHMTGVSSGRGFAGSVFNPYEYPGIFSFQDFHHCGRNGNDDLVNYHDLFEVQNCELLNLADLNSSSDKVQSIQLNLMTQLMTTGVRGFRVDAAKHISATDLNHLLPKVPLKPYFVFEMIKGPEGLQYSDYYHLGDVNVFEVPFVLGNTFREKKISSLFKVFQGNGLPPSEKAVIFVENHDLQRMLSDDILTLQKNPRLYLLAHVFLLSWPYGYPQLFSGYKFSDFDQGPPVDERGYVKSIFGSNRNACNEPWLCEHRIPIIRKLVNFRNQTNHLFTATNLWSDSPDHIAFGRGNLGMVLINVSNSVWQAKIPSSMAMGTYCNILNSDFEPLRDPCTRPDVKVDSQGVLETQIPPLQAVVIQHNISSTRGLNKRL